MFVYLFILGQPVLPLPLALFPALPSTDLWHLQCLLWVGLWHLEPSRHFLGLSWALLGELGSSPEGQAGPRTQTEFLPTAACAGPEEQTWGSSNRSLWCGCWKSPKTCIKFTAALGMSERSRSSVLGAPLWGKKSLGWSAIKQFIPNALKLGFSRMYQKEFWSWKSGSLLLLLEGATFSSHIPKNKASCALKGCHFADWKHCCLFLENALCSSLDSYTYSLKFSVLNPGTVRRKTTIRQLGFGVGFPWKAMVLPAVAMWKSLAPSCGLLCSELTEVPVPCCSSGISPLCSIFTFSVFNLWFSGALCCLALGKFCGYGKRASRGLGGFCAWALFNS